MGSQRGKYTHRCGWAQMLGHILGDEAQELGEALGHHGRLRGVNAALLNQLIHLLLLASRIQNSIHEIGHRLGLRTIAGRTDR